MSDSVNAIILVEGVFDVLVLLRIFEELSLVKDVYSFYLAGRRKYVDGAKILETSKESFSIIPCGGKSEVMAYLEGFMNDVETDVAYITVELSKGPGSTNLMIGLKGNTVIRIIDRNSEDLESFQKFGET